MTTRTATRTKSRAQQIETARRAVDSLNRTLAEASELRAKLRALHATAQQKLADAQSLFASMTPAEKQANGWALHWERVDRLTLAHNVALTFNDLIGD